MIPRCLPLIVLAGLSACHVGGPPPSGPQPGPKPLPFNAELSSPQTAYYEALQKKIFTPWAPPAALLEKIGDKGLATELALSVRADGSLANIAVVAASGVQEMDASAMQALVGAAPYPPPPTSILGPNGQALMTWKFTCSKKGN